MDRAHLSGIAVDIGGTKIAAARIEHGEIKQRVRQQTDADASIESLLEQLHELVNQVSIEPVKHIGFAVTGRIDSQGNWHAVNTSTLRSVESVPFATLLEARLGQQVSVRNDALAGAIAEYHFGAGGGALPGSGECVGRLAYITVSTGVGAGFVFDGVPLQSPKGLVGHVGFTSSRYSKRDCGSGRMGTVESVASGTAIAQAAHEQGHAGLDAKAVFTAARNGESWALNIIEHSADAIAESITDLVALLDINKVVLGGSVGLAQGYIEKVVNAQQKQPELFRVPVVRSLLDDAVLLGALVSNSH